LVLITLRTNGSVSNVFISSYSDSYFNGGNVGIGTNSPGAKLHVSYAGTDSSGVRLAGGGGTTAGNMLLSKITEYSDTSPINLFWADHSNTGRDNNLVRIHSNETGTSSLPLRVTAQGTLASPTYEALAVNYLGNVGIGTDNPASKLHVYTNSGVNVNIIVEEETGQAGLRLLAGSGATNRATRIDFLNKVSSTTVPRWTLINDYNQNGTNDFSIVNSDPTNRVLVINQSGNVGIGTNAPAHLLSIYGTPVSDGALNVVQKISSNAASSTIPSSGLGFGANYTTGGLNAVLSGIAGGKENATSGNFAGVLNFYTRPNGGDHTERMRITSGGNVGIGTTSPGYILDILNNSTRFSFATGTGDAIFYMDGANGDLAGGDYTSMTSDGSGNFNIGTGNAERLRIEKLGNVGINITSPTQILHVSGNIAQTLGTATTTHFVGITGSLTTNTVVASLDVATQPAYGVFFDYVVYDDAEPPTNARAGNIMTVNNNSTSRYTDTSTSDIGDTTPVDFSTSISGNNLLLTANIASGTWYVRLNYRRF
jgi:hypothetical protein